jgi:hypothetical protein
MDATSSFETLKNIEQTTGYHVLSDPNLPLMFIMKLLTQMQWLYSFPDSETRLLKI